MEPPSRSSHPSVRVALEPVFNALNSFALLNEVEHLSGLNTWVVQTAAALTPEQCHTHRLVFEGLRDALTPVYDEPNFPSYLHTMTELNPFVVRKMVIEPLRKRFSHRVSYATPDTKRLFNDADAFLYCVRHVQGDARFDAELQREVHQLLQDPAALHSLILSHLELMWKTTFVAEWRRVQPPLQHQTTMFTHAVDENATIEETFHTLTGRRLPPGIAQVTEDTTEIILILSWHTGRHVTTWNAAFWDEGWENLEKQETIRLFFSEPPNYDVAALRATPVGRKELYARLSALADETRLSIIEFLTKHDELPAQDIIASLNLSQSSASRHLKQLVSAGYLYERRGEGANKTYRLSSFYFDRTMQAIEQLLSGEDKQVKQEDQNSALPQELKRFLDRGGRLTTWPVAKQRDKLLILEYLASFFELNRVYSEKEVNELLLSHSTFKDAAALRRALYEYRFISRTRDGSRYWLIGSKLPETE